MAPDIIMIAKDAGSFMEVRWQIGEFEVTEEVRWQRVTNGWDSISTKSKGHY